MAYPTFADVPDEVVQRTLVARAKARDREALRTIYDAFAPRIRRFLQGLLGSLSAADDGVQETFVRAFQRIDLVRDDDPLAPWLFGIARNVSLEQRRAQRRDGGALAAPAPPAHREPADGHTPETLLLGNETAALVRRVLGTLSDDRRAALLLRIDHGVPYEEIAKILGWSLAKAKVEVHRARATLHAHLEAHEGGSP